MASLRRKRGETRASRDRAKNFDWVTTGGDEIRSFEMSGERPDAQEADETVSG